ncbi:MAG: SPOR domain-containing protein [Bacillota bacterium]
MIVFVPMVLDSEPRSTKQDAQLTIPPRDNAPPLPAPAPPASVQPQAPATAAPAVPTTPAPAVPAKPAPQPPAKVATVDAKPAPVAAAVTPKLEGFAVQIGAFHEEAKMQQAREKLTGARIAHYTERIETSKGTLIRLRAGPFPTREAADKAAGSIKKAGLDGKVVALP